jgi:hypothetical protein
VAFANSGPGALYSGMHMNGDTSILRHSAAGALALGLLLRLAR